MIQGHDCVSVRDVMIGNFRSPPVASIDLKLLISSAALPNRHAPDHLWAARPGPSLAQFGWEESHSPLTTRLALLGKDFSNLISLI